MEEIWKDIKGYEGIYMISNLGRIMSLERRIRYGNNYRNVKRKIMNPRRKGKDNPYLTIILYKDKNSKTYHVHRIVALHFVSGYFEGADVNHKDGNKSNNISTNLEWCTRSENILHSRRILKNVFGFQKGNPGPGKVKVVQLTTEGQFIKEWGSIIEAANAVGVKESNIRQCMYDKRHWRRSKGYKWVRADDYYTTTDKSVFNGVIDRRRKNNINFK